MNTRRYNEKIITTTTNLNPTNITVGDRVIFTNGVGNRQITQIGKVVYCNNANGWCNVEVGKVIRPDIAQTKKEYILKTKYKESFHFMDLKKVSASGKADSKAANQVDIAS